MKDRVRKSLRFSLLDGFCASSSLGIVESFVTPLAIALHATVGQVATLASVPTLIAAIAHLQAGPLRNQVGTRKGIILMGVALQTLCLFGLSMVIWLPAGLQFTGILLLMCIFSVTAALANSMWGSLMCEYLPLSKRSGYFGWRNCCLGGITLVATLAAGTYLYLSGRHALAAFMWIFLVAAILRLLSLKFLSLMHEPRLVPQGAPEPPSYRSTLSSNHNFITFLLAAGLMGFCVNLTGPFMSVYLLKELKLNYAFYTAVILALQVSMFWMMGRWGRNADRAGNLKVVQVTSRFLPFTALLWVFSTNPFYLIGVQLVGGIVWAGYNLCVANFVYDSVRERNRVHATGLFSMVTGLATFVGAACGSWLLAHLPPLGGSSFYSLLVIGALARLLVSTFVFPRIREVRRVPKMRGRDLVANILRLQAPAL